MNNQKLGLDTWCVAKFFYFLNVTHFLASNVKTIPIGGISMKRLSLLFISLLIFLSACMNDKPKPEGLEETVIIPLNNLKIMEQKVKAVSKPINENMMVRHQVKGNRVYVECFLPNFTFNSRQKRGDGYLLLTIDGKEIKKIHTAAFMIKGLSKGKHVMKLDLVFHDSSRKQMSKEWTVTILE